ASVGFAPTKLVFVVLAGVDFAFAGRELDLDVVEAARARRRLEDEGGAAGDRAPDPGHGQARGEGGLLVGPPGQLRDLLQVHLQRVKVRLADVQREDVRARGGQRAQGV